MNTTTSLIYMFVHTLLTMEGDYHLSAYPYLTERLHRIDLLYKEVKARTDIQLRPLALTIAELVELNLEGKLPPADITDVINNILDPIESSLAGTKELLDKYQ